MEDDADSAPFSADIDSDEAELAHPLFGIKAEEGHSSDRSNYCAFEETVAWYGTETRQEYAKVHVDERNPRVALPTSVRMSGGTYS